MLLSSAANAQKQSLLPLGNALQDKNFYLFTAIRAEPPVIAVLSHDRALESIRLERAHGLAQARQTCGEDLPCLLKAIVWTDEEIRTISHALSDLYSHQPAVRSLVSGRLRPSGTYALYADRSDAELLIQAWEVCARGLNQIVSVYGLGQAGRYPLIDAASLDPHASTFRDQAGPTLLPTMDTTHPTFFEPALALSLDLLLLNHRDEAARFESLESGVNRAAVEAISHTVWSRYPYTVIVVPGAGGGTEADPLTASGRERITLAAKAFHAGKAPFLLVSGGYVHPAQTRFAEAVEMKKALIQDFAIPEAAILIDPHARHTTTNLRNAARQILRDGIPADRPALVVSDAAQIAYIAAPVFDDRCLRELGYLPVRILAKDSETSLTFLPMPQALEQDPLDPLDP